MNKWHCPTKALRAQGFSCLPAAWTMLTANVMPHDGRARTCLPRKTGFLFAHRILYRIILPGLSVRAALYRSHGPGSSTLDPRGVVAVTGTASCLSTIFRQNDDANSLDCGSNRHGCCCAIRFRSGLSQFTAPGGRQDFWKSPDDQRRNHYQPGLA